MKLVITRINITTWKDDCRNLEFMLNDHYREFCHDENRYEVWDHLCIYECTLWYAEGLYGRQHHRCIDHDDFKETHKLLTEFGKHYDFEVEQFESYESCEDDMLF